MITWDLGGRSPLRPLWRHYYQDCEGIIFVVDSHDRDSYRVEQAKDELNRLLVEEQLKDLPMLIFANKQDLPNSLSPVEVSEELNCASFGHRKYYVQACCATTGDGVYEGFDWLNATMRSKSTEAIMLQKEPLYISKLTARLAQSA